jgi:hypothetical protein
LEGRALPSFVAASSVSAGSGPRTVAVADLNGDGIPDLAVADNSFPYGVSVLLGNGDGTFQPPTNYATPTGDWPTDIVVADLNHDGVPDLIVANLNDGSTDSTVSILLGNGDGTFRPAHDYQAGPQAVSVAVGDFKGNGILDLAVANQYPGSTGGVSLLFGNGDGTFQSPVHLPAGAAPRSVVAADFNRDGKLDLAVTDQASGGGGVNILFGNGDGTFQAPVSYRAGNSPGFLRVADLNGDGAPDLVTTNQTANTVSVLLNQGNGTFGSATTYGTGQFPLTVAVADLNGDSIPDLITANNSGGSVSVLLGQAGGTFASPVDYSAGAGPYSVAVGDFNGDGNLDLVVTNNTFLGSATLLAGRGDGTFLTAANYSVGGRPNVLTVGDVNGDGVPDLVAGSGTAFNILYGNGDGTFRAPVRLTLGASPTALVLADVNGDGIPDLVYTYSSCSETGCTYAVGVQLGNGDDTFQALHSFRTGNNPVSLTVADLNGDGIPDVVTTNAIAGANGTVSVLLGNGDGTFQTANTFSVGQYPQSVAVGDFDGDGVPDLAVALAADSKVTVFHGNGDGTFGPGHDYAVRGAASVVAADFNGDGILDLVTDQSVLLGNGDGTFQTAVSHEFIGNTVVAGDFNGDGVLDLAAAGSPGAGVLLGNGDGTFRPALRYATGTFPVALVAGSFRSDGFLDLAVVNSGSGSVSVLLNGEDWTPSPGAPASQGHRSADRLYNSAEGAASRALPGELRARASLARALSWWLPGQLQPNRSDDVWALL